MTSGRAGIDSCGRFSCPWTDEAFAAPLAGQGNRSAIHSRASHEEAPHARYNRVSAVLCSTDLERSQDFYENKVGLRLSRATIKNHLVFECGDGTTVLIYGRPSPNLADHTQVRFWSSDIAADVRNWPLAALCSIRSSSATSRWSITS